MANWYRPPWIRCSNSLLLRQVLSPCQSTTERMVHLCWSTIMALTRINHDGWSLDWCCECRPAREARAHRSSTAEPSADAGRLCSQPQLESSSQRPQVRLRTLHGQQLSSATIHAYA